MAVAVPDDCEPESRGECCIAVQDGHDEERRLLLTGDVGNCGGWRSGLPRWTSVALPLVAAMLVAAGVLIVGDRRARAPVRLASSTPEFEIFAARQAEEEQESRAAQRLEGKKQDETNEVDKAGEHHKEHGGHDSKVDADMMWQTAQMQHTMQRQEHHADAETDTQGNHREEKSDKLDAKAKANAKPAVLPDSDMMWQTARMKQTMERQERHADAELKLQAEQRKADAKIAKKRAQKVAVEEARERAQKKQQKEREEKEEKEAVGRRKHERSDAARSVLLTALADLMGTTTEAPKPTPKPKPISQKVADGFHWLANGSCLEADLFPITSRAFCEHAAGKLGFNDTSANETTAAGRPEGCYSHDGRSLWVGLKAARQSNDSKVHDSHVRQHICMTHAKKQEMKDWLADLADKEAREALRKKREELKERKAEEKKHKEEEKKEKKELAVEKWDKDEKRLANVSLYCFSLMMPFGYEPGLLREQEKRKVGIYACDEAAVFSNTTVILSTGERSPVEVTLMNESLAVAYGGKWMTALNTGVFNHLWMEVLRLGRYRFHDWVVKADPDAVFFPSRLRQLLRHKTPFNEEEVQRRVPQPNNLKCGNCQLKGKQEETCASHVRYWQQKGHTCKAALKLVSREPPTDCGCDCDDFACDIPGSAMYLNNCKWGLHGPIEVLSRRAVAMYAAGLPRCVPLLQNPWGEDKFLDQCMQQLGVTRINEYSLLSETACGEQPAPCGTSKVAFHPFKSIQSYFTCHEYASKYGNGPAARPRLDIQEEDFA